MTNFLQQVINGVGIGSQYALWAVGYGLVYQVLGLMHFAHGDTLIFATFVCYALLSAGVPFVAALPIAALAAAAIAIFIEKTVYRPLVSRGELFLAFVGALGAAFILQNLERLIWGVNAKTFPFEITSKAINLGSLHISEATILNLGVAILVIGAFQLYLRYARYGQAITAVAQDRTTAALMGVNVNRAVAAVYGLSGAIGLIGAVMYVAQVHSLQIQLGFTITLFAFMSALIGGLGSVKAALAGGLALGIAQSLIQAYISTVMVDAVIAVLIIAFLVVRPSGISGRVVTARL